MEMIKAEINEIENEHQVFLKPAFLKKPIENAIIW